MTEPTSTLEKRRLALEAILAAMAELARRLLGLGNIHGIYTLGLDGQVGSWSAMIHAPKGC